MGIKRSKEIEKILKDADKKDLSGAEIAALTILGLNPLVFGTPGNTILKLTCLLTNYLECQYMLAKHEAQAVFAASGYGATSKVPAFVLVTSGPGILNSLTGVYDATMEFYPVVVISGNVESSTLKNKDLMAFQKAYVVEGGKYFAKDAIGVTSADNIQKAIIDSFSKAFKLPKGAIIVDITRDAFKGKAKFNYFEPVVLKDDFKKPDLRLLKQVAELLSNAQRPFVVLGRGAFEARKEVWQLIENLKLPFGYTLKGKGVLPDDHPQNYRYLGMHGFEATNKALYNADLVIAIGTSCDDAAFQNPKEFTKGKKVVINPYLKNILARITPNTAIESGAQESITELFKIINQDSYQKNLKKNYAALVKWHETLREYWSSDSNKVYNKKGTFVSPVDAAKLFSDFYNPDTLILDVGEHQQHAARFLELKALIYTDKSSLFATTEISFIDRFNKEVLTSGSAGTMGISISYDFGVSIALQKRETLTILGDGTLEMHLSALWFWAHNYDYKYRCLIFNNREYGEMVKPGFGSCKYKERYLNTTIIKDGPNGKVIVPDFSAISKLYNFEYYYADNDKSFLDNLAKASKSSDTYLFEVLVDKLGCYPFIPPRGTVLDIITSPE